MADALPHGSAALFVLVSEKEADGILERLRGVAGTVLRRPFNKSAMEAVYGSRRGVADAGCDQGQHFNSRLKPHGGRHAALAEKSGLQPAASRP